MVMVAIMAGVVRSLVVLQDCSNRWCICGRALIRCVVLRTGAYVSRVLACVCVVRGNCIFTVAATI